MAAATDHREFAFNKFGAVAKIAGFSIVTVGYIIRSVSRGYQGDRSIGSLVEEMTPLGTVIFGLVLFGLATCLVAALRRPRSRLTLSPDQVALRAGPVRQQIDRSSIVAAAAFERSRHGPWPRRPRRSIAVFSDAGTNLGPIPGNARWRSTTPIGGRGRITASPAQRIKDLERLHPELKAMIVPLHGMPADTEDALRAAIPHWI